METISTPQTFSPCAQVAIHPARIEDSTALTSIAQLAKASWGYPQAWLDAWRNELTISKAYISNHPVFVARGAGSSAPPLGFASISFLSADTAELDHLWVLPEWQGCGLGRRLLVRAVEYARDQAAHNLLVTADPNAVTFYTHLGAAPLDSHTYQLLGETRTLPRLIISLK